MKNILYNGSRQSGLFLIFFLLCQALFGQTPDDWKTAYERSGYRETPRYPETIDYCRRLAEASPWIKYTSFGISPEGRELPLLILDSNSRFDGQSARQSGKAIVLIQSAIHAGECDGKDACLMLMREIAVTRSLAHFLKNVTLLIIPIFNVDGHENFGPYKRINQNGPREMGARATAQNLNLNRDFLKAAAPEMRAWLRLFNEWLPDFLVDIHVTDGADHQYVLTYGLEDGPHVAAPLRRWNNEILEPYLRQQMAAEGKPIRRYFWMKERPDIRRGIVCAAFSPRYSNGYGAIQNRTFLLVETHALKDYRTRVTGTYRLLQHLLAILNRRHKDLLAANRAADQLTATDLSGRSFPLKLDVDSEKSRPTTFLGKAFRLVESDVSGGLWVQYQDRPETMEIPLFDALTIGDSAELPHAYLIPAQWRTHLEILALHGITVNRLARDTVLSVERYRLYDPKWRSTPFEGRLMVDAALEPFMEDRLFPAGTAVVNMNQRTNRIIAHLLEPRGPDALLRWGYWNTIFERKEYGEDYVLEKIAGDMLRENPALRREFEAALAADTALAADRWARLYFFYARTPYWEKDVNVYPVSRWMSPEPLPVR